MYETSSDQSRLCMEFPHSSLSNQGHKRLVIFVQEEPIEAFLRNDGEIADGNSIIGHEVVQ